MLECSLQVSARPFFNAAAQAGLQEYVLQLCGQGYPMCRECSAGVLLQLLVAEADDCVLQLGTKQ